MENPKEIAQKLASSGMSINSFDLDKAVSILNMEEERFNNMSFHVFVELMKIEINNT